jgi:hypothetical protein
MQSNKTAIERAFELARSGAFKSVSQVKAAVSAEGYPAAQLVGPMLMRQIRELLITSQAEKSS